MTFLRKGITPTLTLISLALTLAAELYFVGGSTDTSDGTDDLLWLAEGHSRDFDGSPGLASYAAVSTKPLYEVVPVGSERDVDDVIAELKGGARKGACSSGGSGFGCLNVDGKVIDFGRAAGLDFVFPLVHNGRHMVAGYGVAGGWQGVIDYWRRWVFVHFVAGAAGDPLRYQYPTRTAFVHDGHRILRIEGLGGTDTSVYAINALRHVVGESENRSGEFHAFVHCDGRSVDLGTLGGRYSRARDINDRGEVVGGSTNGKGDERAFLHRQGQMSDLGTLGGQQSIAFSINNQGQIVGFSTAANDADLAFLYDKGQMFDLSRLIASPSAWRLEGAYFIDDRGNIVASGVDQYGESQTVILRRLDMKDPIKEPSFKNTMQLL